VLLGFAVLAIAMALASASLGARLGFAAFGLLIAMGGVRQVMLLRSPLVMFTVTGDGITTYLDGPRYTRRGFSLPWSEVRSIELVRRRIQPGNRRCVTVAVEVDAGRSVPRAVSYGATDEDGRILHLDAMTGDLRGEALLEAVRSAWLRFVDADRTWTN